ncbi:cytidine deaminase [Paenibacillus sp. MMS20-IR301]|uniref:cytidine deaminase n=1 Tax=Paenibacillus sp. MMS20-IR301 TaxID=2895946 RepID=UPI0028E281C2|nr:cytidine deaminase [Paenibacillus sp. MMS20-IR301]WNS46070.1 cytidine deaminase [Paenibacillus sp. MMS20-IR301]
MNKEQLMEQARAVKHAAYAPYSKFPVGAAILLKDGTVITGVNVENVSFGATNCAERTAFFTAVARGYAKGDFQAIAVAGDTEDFLPPCSICRQVMAEFCYPDMPVYLTNNKQDILELKLRELLPYAFTDLDM